MEWIETTAKTLDDAKDLALDRLGVAADEAEFDVLEEPRSGLFGRLRGEARVRARVKPASVRPKQDRRGRGKRSGGRGNGERSGGGRKQGGGSQGSGESSNGSGRQRGGQGGQGGQGGGRDRNRGRGGQQRSREDQDGGRRQDAAAEGSREQRSSTKQRPKQHKEQAMHDDEQGSPVTPEEVGDAAVAFMSGLAEALGAEATTTVAVDGTEIDVAVSGNELGLLVGPGGRTLTAVQDLARVASQRRLGDHDTRLRIDVGGYREKRREALVKFAGAVADQVLESGNPKALEPMASPDRKVVHDAVVEIDGVSSRSEGDEPRRRVVIVPE